MSAKSPARPAGAPPSSPRLPSPPPLPELQLGPRSPSINATGGELSLEDAAAQDEGAARRVRPGTSATDMARGPPFVPLHQLESPFQLQEYLKSSYSDATRDENSDTVKPITKESAMQLATPPIQQDTGDPVNRNLWLYELCRFLVQRTNRLIVSFFADSPPCSSQTCPEMRASEWQYLCAVHEPPKSCCAIDYCCHTLDWAANVLTSPKHFPSRLSLGGEGGSAYQSMRQLTNIFRRVYRIYAHAWFQHREMFWSLEQEEGLYKFFRTVCDAYSLIPEDNYTIPHEAEAERDDMIETPVNQRMSDVQILTNDQQGDSTQQETPASDSEPPSVPGPTVRRHGHRHTPSTGTHVTVIAEGSEEEEEGASPAPLPQVLPESNATSITLSSSPTRPQLTEPSTRSPRPAMSIPIDNKRAFGQPVDPTPTPERHASDPFLDQSAIQATREAAGTEPTDQPPVYAESPHPEVVSNPLEASSTLSAAAIYGSPDLPTSKTPIPPLQTRTPPRLINDDEEVRSPGGGSIRTVGGDILSGILRHTDDEDQDYLQAAKTEQTGSVVASEEISKSADENQRSESKSPPKEEEEQPQPIIKSEESSKPDEDLEEMGEIKLVETAINTNDQEETKTSEADSTGEIETVTVKKEEDVEVKKEGTEDEEKRDDGTKSEETPSGVV